MMTTELALAYTQARMNGLGYGANCSIQLRHLVLMPHEKRYIHCDEGLLVLAGINENISVKSSFGVFDVTVTTSNELQYEHQGKVRIKNLSGFVQHVTFIQAVPVSG